MNSATAHSGASNPAPIGGRTPVQMDWENRDAVEGLHIGVRRIAEFLIRFDLDARYSLSKVEEKLSMLERKLALLEAQVKSLPP